MPAAKFSLQTANYQSVLVEIIKQFYTTNLQAICMPLINADYCRRKLLLQPVLQSIVQLAQQAGEAAAGQAAVDKSEDLPAYTSPHQPHHSLLVRLGSIT